MDINIRNFQCIKKADFSIEPGLTVIVGPSNNGKCVSGDTYVRTSRGLRMMKDFITDGSLSDEFEPIEEELLLNGQICQADSFYNAGVTPTLSITTYSGTNLKCSLEGELIYRWNPRKFVAEWVPSEELRIGDYLIVDCNPAYNEDLVGQFSNKVPFREFIDFMGKRVFMVTEDAVELFIFLDHCYDEFTRSYGFRTRQQKDRFRHLMRQFNFPPTEGFQSNGGYRVRVSSLNGVPFNEAFKRHMDSSSLLEVVRLSKFEVQKRFVKVLLELFSYDLIYGYVRFLYGNDEVSKFVCEFLKSVGYLVSSRCGELQIFAGPKIEDSREYFGKRKLTKQFYLDMLVPGSEIYSYVLAKTSQYCYKPLNLVEFSKVAGMVGGLQDILKRGWVLDRVECLERLGDMKLYDFVVEDKHAFAANGIIVHNSSVFRAIESAVYNKSSDTQITAGQTAMLVKYSHNDHSFIFKRDSTRGSKVAYQVDGEIYSKPGRNQLPIIAELFGFGEIQILSNKEHLNFWKQMKFPFLLDRTGSQLFEFLSFSDEVLLGISKQIKRDLQQMDKDRDALVIKHDLYKTKSEEMEKLLKSYDKLPKIRDYLQRLRGPVMKVSALSEILTKISEVSIRKKQLESQVQVWDSKYKSMSELDLVKKEVDFTQKLKADLDRVISARRSFDDSQGRVEKFKQRLEDYSRIDIIKALLDTEANLEQERVKLENLLGSLKEALELVKKMTKRIEDYMQLKSEIEKDLSEFNVCPLCGNSLGGTVNV